LPVLATVTQLYLIQRFVSPGQNAGHYWEAMPALPLVAYIAAALNAPALLAGLFTGMVLGWLEISTNPYLHIIYVPLLWYAVGRWIDAQRGSIARKLPRYPQESKLGWGIAFAVGCLLLIFAVGNGVAWTRNHYENRLLQLVAFLPWSMWLLIISISGWRRVRRLRTSV